MSFSSALLFVLSAALACSAVSGQDVGRAINCPGHTSYKTGIDVNIQWKPFALKPNTMYTVNGNLTVHQDINDVIASGKVYVRGGKDPIYTFPETKTTCKGGDLQPVLSFLNVTCPIQKDTFRALVNFQQFLPGTQAAITGDFTVFAILENLKGDEIACVTANLTITN